MTWVSTGTSKYFKRTFGATSVPAAVEKAARDLRSDLLGDYPDIPVDVEALARAVGIEISPLPPKAGCLEGALVPDRDRFVLYLRSGVSPQRLRFSLAHEIGHTLFYSPPPIRKHQIGILAQDEINAEERICNMLASALLIPSEVLQRMFTLKQMADPWGELLYLEHVARTFKVSLPVLIRRIAYVAVKAIPSLVLIFEHVLHAYTHADEDLRVTAVASLGSARNRYSIWMNQTANGLGLMTAARLYSLWREQGVSQDGKIKLAGKIVLNDDGELFHPEGASDCQHSVSVEMSEFHLGRWSKKIVDTKCAVALYARPGGHAQEAYVVAVLELGPS